MYNNNNNCNYNAKVKGNNGGWSAVFNAPSIENIFTDLLNGTGIETSFTRQPAVNIRQRENEYVIEMLAPGFTKEEIKINLKENHLTVSGEKSAEAEEVKKEYIRREFVQGKFSRTFTLPEKADSHNIKAEFKNGILFVSIPIVQEQKTNAREIVIE